MPTCRASPRITRRALLAATAFLALGALINIAVTWSLAAWLPQTGWHERTYCELKSARPYGTFVLVEDFRTAGAVRRDWLNPMPGVHAPPSFLNSIDASVPLTLDPDVASRPIPGQHWGRVESIRGDPASGPRDGCEHATGFPFLAAWYELVADTTTRSPHYEIHAEGGIPLPGLPAPAWIGTDASKLRALPYRPIWPGFLLNTLIYAALAWTLYYLTPAARRFRRRRRNQCPTCGYDLAGLTPGALCPECGTPTK